ncbi:helix-turn-helix transcriptional regulator [Nocardia sp. NPDC050435]|uniref:helix-turn-helix domain-containing protein n=1 Tax=Nocardia sp. NPDC050435 TaxID=3155040 RepID=UPI0033DB93B4
MTRSVRESPVGTLLREWRQRRRLSQLELALAADSSARHLSCVETGKAQPSRAMVLKLCDVLDVPLRERNTVLLAGGFAPEYRESDLDDAPLTAARAALDTMLTAHEPYPAIAVDRHWNVVATNRAMSLFAGEVDEHLMRRPNVYRLALHPGPPGAATYMINHGQVRDFLLARLLRQVRATGDPVLRDLYDEVSGYPVPTRTEPDPGAPTAFAVPLRIASPAGELRMFSTMVTFGAPSDVTLAELAIELFYPMDEFTADTLRTLFTADAGAGTRP